MSTLYELTGDYMNLLEWLEDEENLEDAAVKDTLDGIGGAIEDKADNYAKIIKELKAEAKKFAEEKKRLEERQQAMENRAKLLNKHLYDSMKLTGKTKFKTGLFSFGIQKNGGLQPIEIDTENVPDECMKKEPDNTLIRQALKEGKELPFVTLKEYGDHLVIR
jgi:predicted nuclease with TOPRIM domain